MPIVKAFKVGGVAEEIGQLRTVFPDDRHLAGVRSKLERVREHLRELNDEIIEYLARGPYVIKEERKRGGREIMFRMHIREVPPLA